MTEQNEDWDGQKFVPYLCPHCGNKHTECVRVLLKGISVTCHLCRIVYYERIERDTRAYELQEAQDRINRLEKWMRSIEKAENEREDK